MAFAGFLIATAAHAQPATGIAYVRHAPVLNGTVQGSVQQMTAENTTFNGGASLSGSLLVPGTPTVKLNGSPSYGGATDGAGVSTPTNYTITLNGGSTLGRLIRRTNAASLPTVIGSAAAEWEQKRFTQ